MDILGPFFQTAFNSRAAVSFVMDHGVLDAAWGIMVDGVKIADVFKDKVRVKGQEFYAADPLFLDKIKSAAWSILCDPDVIRRREYYREAQRTKNERQIVDYFHGHHHQRGE